MSPYRNAISIACLALAACLDIELRSMSDFDAARKGLFLCGDFTDRAALVRNIDLKNITSGDGFADAKSGPDRFPTGPLLVVPRDWKTFLGGVTIATHVDGAPRQAARAADMIKDLPTIVRETLSEAGTRTWSYGGARIPMVARPAIGTGSAISSAGFDTLEAARRYTCALRDSTKQGGGQGLGLFLTRRVCERFGWRLTMSSRPGQGTLAELRFAPAR